MGVIPLTSILSHKGRGSLGLILVLLGSSCVFVAWHVKSPQPPFTKGGLGGFRLYQPDAPDRLADHYWKPVGEGTRGTAANWSDVGKTVPDRRD